MAIVSRSNQAALYALRGLNGATDLLNRTTRRLSTGLRIENASDDPAGFVFAQNLRTRLKSLQGINDYNQSSRSMVQTIRTLAVSSSNVTLTTADREANQTQVASLRDEITSIANNTFFNAKNLLSGDYATGTATLRFQVGVDSGNTITLNIRTVTAAALGISAIDVSTQAGGSAALASVDSAINISNDESANLGAVENRLESSGTFLSNQIENHQNALGGVEDADLASETVQFALAQVLRQTSASALAQANIYPQNVLSVILPGA